MSEKNISLSHGWAVGHGTDSGGDPNVMLFILSGPLGLSPDDAEAMAIALLTSAKSLKQQEEST